MKKYLFLFITLFMMGCNSSDDTAKEWYDDLYFEHPAMKQCLISWVEEYGWTSAEEVTKLSCSRNGIDSIAGIEQFENLSRLYLSYTALKELDLSGNPKLDYINIGKNPYLKSVDVSQNLELTAMYVYENAVEEINLSNLPKLDHAFLNNNHIKALKLDGTDVRYLNVENNLIENIDLSNARSIRDLTLTGNPITNIDLSNLQDLTALTIYNTGISTLDVSYNQELIVLDAKDNNIESIRFYNNPKLTNVNITNNPLDKDTLDYLATIDWMDVLRY
ncbi:hypothetical protein CXF86_18460 [Shewanella sp. GutCb]|uniref:leucine-rich repeat domain-containing protein n=1 Tax=Shewanella sp. GutCb TaxID=2058315 RepID=UPI000C7CEE02|nr:leucine-rich repeat domain-containing protein [Shewanella sp. GutCb]PKG73285.1 hypothetical protein CXF86_18460 [Shewanella sp. GutCb]